MTAKKIQNLLQQEFPEISMIVEFCGNRCARLRLVVNETHLRPGLFQDRR